MPIIKCKICGGEVDVPVGMTMGECPYCGTLTTFPRLDTSDTETFFRIAEEARLSCNFDKAISAYEEIIGRGTTDPEIYWELVLSTWGIEYVEDPLTKERKPTCHRVQFESILDDANYKKVLELSSGEEAKIYQQEAMKIADIQKNILAISSQEKPFDIFICYKESDDSGQRTLDSVFAQELYDKLCAQGYKVFFAKVTLEDKVGLYEPYIFSALNSAKVMLVIGSKKEYFEAVWVRNEWSRFLFLMRNHSEKVLIPCYRDMDAYDIPKELSLFQAQDMNKIGFVQDLLRGLGKVLGRCVLAHSFPNAAQIQVQDAYGLETLMKRIRIFLETEDFEQAREYCNKVLDKAPENAEAYLFLLMAENKLKNEKELCTLYNDIESLKNFQLALKFADEPFKSDLQTLIRQQRDERVYKELDQKTRMAQSIADWTKLEEGFAAIVEHRDSKLRKQQCKEHIDSLMKKAANDYRNAYQRAMVMQENGATADEWRRLGNDFKRISAIPEAVKMAEWSYHNRDVQLYKDLVNEKNSLMADEQTSVEKWLELAKNFEKFSHDDHFPDAKAEAEVCNGVALEIEYENATACIKEYEEYDSKIIKQIIGDTNGTYTYVTDEYKEDAKKELRRCAAEWRNLALFFESIGDFKDAKEHAAQCHEKMNAMEDNAEHLTWLINKGKIKLGLWTLGITIIVLLMFCYFVIISS